MNQLTLPSLPYPLNSLAPVISKEQLELHYTKHHNAYVVKANETLENLEKARKGDIHLDLRTLTNDFVFNYNGHILHMLFWESMLPSKEYKDPSDKVVKLISKSFGSIAHFQQEFSYLAKSLQGSGWVVLFKDKEQNLFCVQVEKHNINLFAGLTPVLVLDVWEHSYYVDYKNDRAKFVDSWWGVVNWERIRVK